MQSGELRVRGTRKPFETFTVLLWRDELKTNKGKFRQNDFCRASLKTHYIFDHLRDRTHNVKSFSESWDWEFGSELLWTFVSKAKTEAHAFFSSTVFLYYGTSSGFKPKVELHQETKEVTIAMFERKMPVRTVYSAFKIHKIRRWGRNKVEIQTLAAPESLHLSIINKLTRTSLAWTKFICGFHLCFWILERSSLPKFSVAVQLH
jgi:hypothetical protein